MGKLIDLIGLNEFKTKIQQWSENRFSNVGIEVPVTIDSEDWVLEGSDYVYTWSDTRVAASCAVQVYFYDGSEDTNIAYIEYAKVSGGVKFFSRELPTTDLPLIVYIVTAESDAIASINASMVTTDAVDTASNVQEALEILENAGGDFFIQIEPSMWATTAPYTYTWISPKVTADCRVDVDFDDDANDGSITEIEYEKVSGGIKFTSSFKPVSNVRLVIHILNAQAETMASITGDMVNTTVISGANNVNGALTNLNSNLTNKIKRTSVPVTWDSAYGGNLYKSGDIVIAEFFTSGASLAADTWTTIGTIDSAYPAYIDTHFSCIDFIGNPILGRVTGTKYIQILSKNAVTVSNLYGNFSYPLN